jgi:hypothetical protein
LLLPSLVGCCVVVRHPLLSLHAVMRLSTVSLQAAFAANRHPLPPPLPLPLPLLPGRHRLHRRHCGQTPHRPLPKKEATAAAPPTYQRQHQRENVYKSRRLDLSNLSTVSREFSDYQVVSLKKIVPFLQSTY